MKSPFTNDPYAMLALAFERLYPDKKYEAFIGNVPPDPDGREGLGITHFYEEEDPEIIISQNLDMNHAVETLAHEMAHVAAGPSEKHGDKWVQAFDDLFREYNRMGQEMFDTPDEECYVPESKEYQQAIRELGGK